MTRGRKSSVYLCTAHCPAFSRMCKSEWGNFFIFSLSAEWLCTWVRRIRRQGVECNAGFCADSLALAFLWRKVQSVEKWALRFCSFCAGMACVCNELCICSHSVPHTCKMHYFSSRSKTNAEWALKYKEKVSFCRLISKKGIQNNNI